MKERIISLENTKVKYWTKLKTKKGRQEFNKFLIEGKNIVQEATAAGVVEEYITTNNNIEGALVSEKVMNKITGAVTPQEIAAVCSIKEKKELGDKVIFLRNVQDPGNVGTIIRTAAAFGFTDVVVQGADPFSDKALRSSQGAIFKTNVIHTKNITDFFGKHQLIATTLESGAKDFNELKPKKPFALIMGNEGNGLDQEIISKADEKIYIPIQFESLNVAIASALLMEKYK